MNNYFDKEIELTKQFSSVKIIKDFDILIYVADVCNYNCRYCFNFFPRSNLYLDLDLAYEFIKTIRNIICSDRILNVIIVGGEPTMHNRLIDFCNKLVKLTKVTIEIMTNFSKDIDYYIYMLNKKINITASWHSINSDSKNLDFINRIKKIPKKFSENDQFDVSIIMENDNWSNSKNAFFSLYPYFKNTINVYLLANNNGNIYNYSKQQLKEYSQLLILTQKNQKQYTAVVNNQYKKLIFQEIYHNQHISFENWKCHAGLDYLYIHADGNIYNCQSYYENKMKPICNIYNIKFDDIQSMLNSCICKVKYCAADLDVYKEKI